MQTNAKIEKMERDMQTKEDMKTVALGTSKINYMDPRITVAWCKRHDVPIEKVYKRKLQHGDRFGNTWNSLLFCICRYLTSLFWLSLLGQWTLILSSDSE